MKGSQRRENNKKIPIIRYMLYLLVATSVISCVTLSRYVSSVSRVETARVAEFGYSVAITDPISGSAFDSLGLSIFATSKLSEAEDCMFDEVAVVREITVTNESEVAVSAELSIDEIESNGIVWCIFDGSYKDVVGTDEIYKTIEKQLAGVDTTDFNTLKAALIQVNSNTIGTWNSDVNLGIGESKTLTIVFWAEHEPTKDVGGWYDDDVTSPANLTVTVSQID